MLEPEPPDLQQVPELESGLLELRQESDLEPEQVLGQQMQALESPELEQASELGPSELQQALELEQAQQEPLPEQESVNLRVSLTDIPWIHRILP